MQLQGIGTTWMLTPPRRDDDAAWNQTIGQMDLQALKPMMCPKSNGNPLTCMNCDGFRSCTVGQRAVVLTEQATKPEYRQVWTEEQRQKKPVSTGEEREEFKRACSSGNAWNYLMETKGLDKNAAGELLSRLIKKFPGIAADYGGGRRIMQRPRAVKITSVTQEENAPEKPQDAVKQASGPEAEEQNARKEKAAEKAAEAAKKQPEMKYVSKGVTIEQKREDARRIYEECMKAEDPPARYMEIRGVNRIAARNWLSQYRRQHSEAREPKEKPAAQDASRTDEDEISLKDFLNGFTFDEADRREAETQPEEMPPDMPEPDEDAARPETALRDDSEPVCEKTGNAAIDELNSRYEALEREKGGLTDEIRKAQERIRVIEDLQESLKKVMRMLND